LKLYFCFMQGNPNEVQADSVIRNLYYLDADIEEQLEQDGQEPENELVEDWLDDIAQTFEYLEDLRDDFKHNRKEGEVILQEAQQQIDHEIVQPFYGKLLTEITGYDNYSELFTVGADGQVETYPTIGDLQDKYAGLKGFIDTVSSRGEERRAERDFVDWQNTD